MAAVAVTMAFATQTSAQTFPEIHLAQPEEVTISLSEPGSSPITTPHAMVVCYANIVMDGGEWPKLLQGTTGALASYKKANKLGNLWTAGLTGVNATAPVDDDFEFTIDPVIVQNAVDKIQWTTSQITGFARPYLDEMPWPNSGWIAGSTMNWNALASANGPGFNPFKILDACLGRQVGYVLNLAPDHEDVKVRVKAIMDIVRSGQASFELNAILVQLQDDPVTSGPGPTTPTIKLSRTKKIALALPGTSQDPEYYRWGPVYPANPGGFLVVEPYMPPSPNHVFEFFLPTDLGYVAVPGELIPMNNGFGVSCHVPFNLISEGFAIFNVTTTTYMLMATDGDPSTSNFVYLANYQVYNE